MYKLRVGHASMQFSDTPRQKDHDYDAVLSRGYEWVTGTEALQQDAKSALREAAKKHGYRVWIPAGQDSWIAVSRKIIKGKWSTFYSGHIIPGKAGRNAAKGVVTVTFKHVELGWITVGASHYMTKGRVKDKRPLFRTYTALNRKLARAISKRLHKQAKGGRKSFYGGDQNMVDSYEDTFFGGPIVSCWDELNKYPNTGHGNIDVIARAKRDGKVRCVGAKAFTDKQVFLHTDHYLIEATYEVG